MRTGTTNDKILPNHIKDALARINSQYQVHSQVSDIEFQDDVMWLGLRSGVALRE